MFKQKFMLSLLTVTFGLFTACAQQNKPETQTEEIQEEPTKNASVHPYGGWYCPDNLGNFPPVNVAELDRVPVVNGRMPNETEARHGISLMYFDPAEYPTAKPLDITLPKLARYFSPHTQQEELVVVIQAVIVDADTVVGFRYLNGGNGTSWFNEVSFLTNKEVATIGETPFVFLTEKINAPKEKIWSAFTKSSYGQSLAKRFNQEAFFNAPWTNQSKADLHYELVGEKANGYVMTMFGNLYLQIDYNINGQKSVEKLLVMTNEDGTSTVQFVFGPFSANQDQQQVGWEKWLRQVKADSEAK